MPISSPTSRSRRVISMSSRLGVGSPDGWLWTKIAAAALAKISDLNTSRGCTTVHVNEPLAASSTPTMRCLLSSATDQNCSRSADREQFWSVALDNKHRIVGVEEAARGSLTCTVVHPREVFKSLILASAAAAIFVHNHPSGDPTPSREDMEITRRLREVGELIGIRILDHLVIGHGRYVSMTDDGYW